jgi:hypothetical protein
MTGNELTRFIASTSALIALCSLGWTVASWRLAGPALRFHALWYRDALVVRVFNAGRIADSVEQLEIGSTRRFALTGALELPMRIEPGQAMRWVVSAADLPESRRLALSGGWCSLWVLTGSMRQRRYEIVPLRHQAPATGWQLVPRRAKWARFVPLLSTLAASVVVFSGNAEARETAAVLVFIPVMCWALVRSVTTAPQFSRRKVERRWSLATAALAMYGFVDASDSNYSMMPGWLVLLWAVLFAGSIYLAAPRYGDYWVEWPMAVRRSWTAAAATGVDPRPGSDD